VVCEACGQQDRYPRLNRPLWRGIGEWPVRLIATVGRRWGVHVLRPLPDAGNPYWNHELQWSVREYE